MPRKSLVQAGGGCAPALPRDGSLTLTPPRVSDRTSTISPSVFPTGKEAKSHLSHLLLVSYAACEREDRPADVAGAAGVMLDELTDQSIYPVGEARADAADFPPIGGMRS